MESYNLKNTVMLAISFLGVLFFGYTWLSTGYNDISNYDYLRNNFGQFAFFGFTMLFVYKLLKSLGREALFTTVIIVSFIAILILFLAKQILLWPFAIVLVISLFFFLIRRWL